jgi:hypothetical protein
MHLVAAALAEKLGRSGTLGSSTSRRRPVASRGRRGRSSGTARRRFLALNRSSCSSPWPSTSGSEAVAIVATLVDVSVVEIHIGRVLSPLPCNSDGMLAREISSTK